MKLLKPKRNETIVVQVAAAPSELKFCSLLQGKYKYKVKVSLIFEY